PMPDVPAPEGLVDWEDLRVQVLGPGTTRRPDGPLEVRDADPASAAPAAGRAARRPRWRPPRVRAGPGGRRPADRAGAAPGGGRPARRRLWTRPREPLPDDPLVHAAVLAYASDRGLLSTAGRPHGPLWGGGLGASLDHAVWFHALPRFDDWVLFDATSPVA